MATAYSEPTDELLQELNISRSQYKQLQNFREVVKDVLKPQHDDHYLVRWMRARQFDIKKAEVMLRKSVEWRMRWRADHVLTDWKCPDVLKRYDIGGKVCYDKQGCPVYIYLNANLDTKGLYYSVNRRDMIKKYIHKMETFHVDIADQSQRLGKRIDKAIVICDLQGFTVQHLFATGMDVVLKIFQMIESNYPEDLKRAYVINGSGIFPLVFRITKPFMNEETRKRIIILGSNYKEKLLEVIDASELPVHWGGTKRDPVTGDEYCSSLVCMGGKVPQELYLKGSNLVNVKDVVKLHVNAARSSDVEYTVHKDNVVLRYTFWTESYDIKFGIFRKNAHEGNELTEVLATVKYNAHAVPEDGSITCDKPATYVFRFDNTYSWFHGKDVFYAIQTIDPSTVEMPSSVSSASDLCETPTAANSADDDAALVTSSSDSHQSNNNSTSCKLTVS